jgi:hypothetical protein
VKTYKNETSSAEQQAQLIAYLQELVAALDRRLPHIERAGEQGIAADSAMLRQNALERIAQLQATAHAIVREETSK